MKRVVVMGSGMVARPLVRYLLGRSDIALTVTDVDGDRAQALVAGSERGTARAVDARDLSAVRDVLQGAELCVSVLPFQLEPGVAKVALASRCHLVSASYGEEAGFNELHEDVRAAGLTFLPEVGLDPGLDHMANARMIARAHERGGTVTSLRSCCGGLPAYEACTNPWDYKFSWNPMGAVGSMRDGARYLEGGREVVLPGERLFTKHWFVTVPGFGELEAHCNGDSLPYVGIYGLEGVQDFVRATLRYPGWSFTGLKLQQIGYLGVDVVDESIRTYEELTRTLIRSMPGADLVEDLARAMDVDPRSDPLTRVTWLGLTDADPIVWPAGYPHTPLAALGGRMLERMMFDEGERDLCVQYNEIETTYPSGERERASATLIAYGEPGGDSSMALTVGTPVAVSAAMILDGRITERGVIRPVTPGIYGPILDELAAAGIAFVERTESLA